MRSGAKPNGGYDKRLKIKDSSSTLKMYDHRVERTL
jgi:hypothetical protein